MMENAPRPGHVRHTWGNKGFVNTPEECGGYPILKHKKARADKNRNGIPDKVEKKYSDIEDYLNSLVKLKIVRLSPLPALCVRER